MNHDHSYKERQKYTINIRVRKHKGFGYEYRLDKMVSPLSHPVLSMNCGYKTAREAVCAAVNVAKKFIDLEQHSYCIMDIEVAE